VVRKEVVLLEKKSPLAPMFPQLNIRGIILSALFYSCFLFVPLD
jgi:hypothetical protein